MSLRQPNSDAITDTICWLARIYGEAIAKLDQYEKRVNEGTDLQAALEFSGWILWSGLTKLMQMHARQSPKIDGDFLRWRAEELQRNVREKWQHPNKPPQVPLAVLQSIEHKLDLIAAQIQRTYR